MLKRILVGIGGTRFTGVAVRRAVELARLHGAKVTGVTVVNTRQLAYVGAAPIGGAAAAGELRDYRVHMNEEHINEAVVRFEAAATAASIQHTVCHETGDPFSLMTSLARYHDLMIFGLRSIFDGGFGVEPPDALARMIEHSVRPIVAVSDEFRPIRRVLMAYSGSPESAKTIKRFIQMRLWPELTLRLLACGGPEDKARRRLDDMAAYCHGHGFEPETHFIDGTPKREILYHAQQWDADLIVLGNSGRNYLMRKVFGETAVHVMQNAERPLFLSY